MPNMNKDQRAKAWKYILSEYGAECTTRNGYGCGKTLKELNAERAIITKLTGRIFKLPALQIDCIPNDGDHSDFTKLQPLCVSCHKLKNKHIIPDTSAIIGSEPTREKRDNLNYKPTYHKNLQDYLLKNEEICYNEMIYASASFSGGGNQVTCKRYFTDEKFTRANPFGKYRAFHYKCGSDDCNGVHVCMRDIPPMFIIKKEVATIRSMYNQEIKFNKITEKGTPFIEYYENKSILIGQFIDNNKVDLTRLCDITI